MVLRSDKLIVSGRKGCPVIDEVLQPRYTGKNI